MTVAETLEACLFDWKAKDKNKCSLIFNIYCKNCLSFISIWIVDSTTSWKTHDSVLSVIHCIHTGEEEKDRPEVRAALLFRCRRTDGFPNVTMQTLVRMFAGLSSFVLFSECSQFFEQLI